MGILHKLGGRHVLLANPIARRIARAAVRSGLGKIGDVAESFRGTFDVEGYGISVRYNLAARDALGEILYWEGLQRVEPATVPLFLKLANTARGVLDIGSNTGLYTILACAVNPSLRVYSWEPVPYLNEKLRTNLSINGFESRCSPRQAAAGAHSGEADFYISDDTQMSSLSIEFATSKGHVAEKTRVDVETVDSIVPIDFPVDLVKLDVEGYEFDALLGAKRTLERWRPKIIFECLPETDARQVEGLLRGLGYLIYGLSASAGPILIGEIGPKSGNEHNYFASTRM